MSYVIIALAAIFTSGLTMFSGFGLGTLLFPVFVFFMPVDMAIASTAIVHAANNILKTILLGKMADLKIVLKFGLPAIAAAFIGALVLGLISKMPVIFQYEIFEVTPLKLILGILILFFALFELHPKFVNLSFDQRYLPVGGLLSGFFGGLSGHQGALRSAFLAKTHITAKAFIGTNAVIGLLVDTIRLAVYGAIIILPNIPDLRASNKGALIMVGILAAFAGVVIGKRLIHKVTMRTIQYITGILLLLIGSLLATGIF